MYISADEQTGTCLEPFSNEEIICKSIIGTLSLPTRLHTSFLSLAGTSQFHSLMSGVKIFSLEGLDLLGAIKNTSALVVLSNSRTVRTHGITVLAMNIEHLVA